MTRPALVIVGGEEIQRTAPQTIWEVINRDLHHHFDDGRHFDGILKAIAQVAL